MTGNTITGLMLFVALILCACDPGIGVAIQNRTNEEKTIQVIYPANFKFPGDSGDRPCNFCIRDSVITFDLTQKENYLHPFVIPMTMWDTAARTYVFILKPNHEAVVESRFMAALPTFGQIFILNQTDTIKLKQRGKDFHKRPKIFWGGSWTHIISDSR